MPADAKAPNFLRLESRRRGEIMGNGAAPCVLASRDVPLVRDHHRSFLLHTLFRTFVLVLFGLLSAACTADETGVEGPGAPGVSDVDIVLGSSLALTGHAGYLGTQTLRGAEAYLRYVNENGGVHGRAVRIKAFDDEYDPPRCLANTQRFIIDDDVFALFNYVGTPTTLKALPLVDEARIPIVGMFTGANALREPFNRYVINVRASYYQETRAAIERLVRDLGLERIAVFYQFDAYGFDGLIGAELALKEFGLEPVARGSYIRGTVRVSEGLEKIQRSDAQAVVMVGTYTASAAFIAMARSRDFDPVFYNVSFVGAEELARRIGHGPELNVLMSQVVPSPHSESGAAREYVQRLAMFFPNDEPSYAGLEGYLNARILVEGLRLAGRDLTRERFIDALESMGDFRLGPDLTISYGPDDRQGLDAVHFTRLEEGNFVAFDDWAGLKRQLEAP